MEASWVLVVLNAIALVSAAGSAIYTWNTNRHRATRQEIENVRGRVAELEERRAKSIGELRDRMGRLEAELPHLPSTETVHELAIRIEEMHGDLKGVTEALKGVKGQLETVNMHLLNESRKP